MSEELLRRAAGEGWARRERSVLETAHRFGRLGTAIAGFDPGSPLPAMLAKAADDARRHAGLCGELRAAYGEPAAPEVGDAPIAPPTLGLRGAALYELVATCCIGVTGSVAAVATLLAGPAEPEVRVVLHEIARDEVVHSRLGWVHLAREAAAGDVSFLARWIPKMLYGAAGDGLFTAADEAGESEELLRWGLLPRARQRELFAHTLTEVVFPGLERFGVDTAAARGWLAARTAEGTG